MDVILHFPTGARLRFIHLCTHELKVAQGGHRNCRSTGAQIPYDGGIDWLWTREDR
jgi:hypothetical protein